MHVLRGLQYLSCVCVCVCVGGGGGGGGVVQKNKKDVKRWEAYVSCVSHMTCTYTGSCRCGVHVFYMYVNTCFKAYESLETR